MQLGFSRKSSGTVTFFLHCRAFGMRRANFRRRNIGPTSRWCGEYTLCPTYRDAIRLRQLCRGGNATDRSTAEAGPEIAFGRFRLLPTQRLLLAGDSPVSLGSRALDLLLVLVERPGALLSKQELMVKVWPGIFVDEGNLKVQISMLRRALGDGEAGNRYIATIAGRGYCFVMPVHRTGYPEPAAPQPIATERLDNLPAALP